VLGGDAVENIRSRLEQLSRELQQWEALGRDTTIEDA
jgi:hypothetical protein